MNPKDLIIRKLYVLQRPKGHKPLFDTTMVKKPIKENSRFTKDKVERIKFYEAPEPTPEWEGQWVLYTLKRQGKYDEVQLGVVQKVTAGKSQLLVQQWSEEPEHFKPAWSREVPSTTVHWVGKHIPALSRTALEQHMLGKIKTKEWLALDQWRHSHAWSFVNKKRAKLVCTSYTARQQKWRGVG